MRFIGLAADLVLGRILASDRPLRVPGWSGSVAGGALGFGSVSVMVFACWAYAGRWFYSHVGEAGAYLAWAAIFVVGSGGLLGWLVIGAGSGRRFYGGFAIAFMAYSVVWMAAWFASPDRFGEICGALVGVAAFGACLCGMFGAWRAWSSMMVGLVVGNLVGYFLGGVLHDLYGGNAGKLLWGLSYGLGFGAGMGHALHAVQSGLRRRLSALTEARRRG